MKGIIDLGYEFGAVLTTNSGSLESTRKLILILLTYFYFYTVEACTFS